MALREQLPIREIARRTGLSRNTNKKYSEVIRLDWTRGDPPVRYSPQFFITQSSAVMLTIPNYQSVHWSLPNDSDPKCELVVIGYCY